LDVAETKETKELRNQGETMPAYAVIIREKTRNAAKLDEYKKIAPASFQKHPATFLAIHDRSEVLEGPKSEDIIILEFPSYDGAQAWYHSPEYQAACEYRFQGGDYHCILTEGVSDQMVDVPA
jgi:uncharacterized protein (DUF1330 family)